MILATRLCASIVAMVLMALASSGTAQAQVTVTSAEPSSAPQGTISLDVTVNGNGFDSSAAVSFLVTGTTNPGGITVKKVVVRGSKKLVATIEIADTAVITNFDIQVEMSGGRKGKGTSLFAVLAKTNDPCAALNLDFPAFTFWRWASQEKEIFAADATGQCIRPVLLLTDELDFSGNHHKFSYPIAGTTNVGRLVWSSNDNALVVNEIYVYTFQVDGTSISNGTLERIYDSYPADIGEVDLSVDGTTVYFTMDSRILAIDADGSNLREVFAGARIAAFVLNEDGSFFARPNRPDSSFPGQLVRIGPSCNNPSCWVVIAEFSAGAPGADIVAASLVDNRLAYLSRLQPTSSGCWLLQVIPDTGGPILNSAQPRYGRGELTWHGNKLLTNGYKSPTRQGRCDSTGLITQIDPDTSAEIALVRGFDPDAR